MAPYHIIVNDEFLYGLLTRDKGLAKLLTSTESKPTGAGEKAAEGSLL
ncbi:hypothetical protein [Anoxybacillus sp. FSL W8-1294]|jgi:hypothetical protein